VANPTALVDQARQEGKVAIVIRNQPHGTVAIQQVIPLPRLLSAVQPNGTVVSAVDPNQKYLTTLDARFVLEGQGRKRGGGVVFGNQNLKIGTPVEIEGNNFRITGTVTNLKLSASTPMLKSHRKFWTLTNCCCRFFLCSLRRCLPQDSLPSRKPST
jgi:hypothetical protein